MPAAFLGPKEFVASAEAMSGAWAPAEAVDYTRWLATSHYENFHVVSFLLPKRLHRDFYSVYSFCRWADDLGDETGGGEESLRLLAWWREQLTRMYAGETSHPVFVALRGVVERHDIPEEPFAGLIRAFVQDQTVTRYETWDALLEYCRYSANPVGRLVLRLCGYSDPGRAALADATCTALQLANFWQDVTVDLAKDRVYIPLEALRGRGSGFDDVTGLHATPAFRAAMRDCVDRAQALFEQGLPLAGTVDRRLSLDLDLFSRGGMRVLAKIRERDYDVLSGRPAITRPDRLRLLAAALARAAFRRAA